MLVVAVVALLVAVLAMAVAVRAWPRQGAGTARRNERPARQVVRAVEVLVALDVVAGGVLGYSLLHGSNHARPQRSASQVTRPAGKQHHQLRPTTSATTMPPARRTTTTARRGTTVPVPTTSTSVKAGASGKPVLVSISPSAGGPGQVVTLTGKGFFSHNGLIVVTFGPAQAPVRCPTESVCRATVPARPARTPPGSVMVTLKTQTGVSNGVTFDYR